MFTLTFPPVEECPEHAKTVINDSRFDTNASNPPHLTLLSNMSTTGNTFDTLNPSISIEMRSLPSTPTNSLSTSQSFSAFSNSHPSTSNPGATPPRNKSKSIGDKFPPSKHLKKASSFRRASKFVGISENDLRSPLQPQIQTARLSHLYFATHLFPYSWFIFSGFLGLFVGSSTQTHHQIHHHHDNSTAVVSSIDTRSP